VHQLGRDDVRSDVVSVRCGRKVQKRRLEGSVRKKGTLLEVKTLLLPRSGQ
jgi:hypothetical protein